MDEPSANEESKPLVIERKIIRILNAKNEPPFQMKVDPLEVHFRYIVPNPAFSEVNLQNITAKRQCFKVKISDNKLFKIQPTVGFLEPNQSCFIKFIMNETFMNPPENQHSVGIYHIATSISDFQEIWKKPAEGVIRLHISFEKEGGGEDTVNKTSG